MEKLFWEAGKSALYNKKVLQKVEKCGCYACMRIFDTAQIEIWYPDRKGETAFCPYCGMDAVLPESEKYELTEDFLKKMNKLWL